MKKKLIAKRYAKALFTLVKEKEEDKLQNYGDVLHGLAHACDVNSTLYSVFTSPIISHSEKKGVVASLLHYQEPLSYSMNFCSLLIEAGRIHLIKEIALYYQDFLDAYVGRVNVTITTAFTLDDEDKKLVSSSLSRFGMIVDINYITQPSLLGGMVFTVGDIHVDASLRKELNTIRKCILKGGCYAN